MFELFTDYLMQNCNECELKVVSILVNESSLTLTYYLGVSTSGNLHVLVSISYGNGGVHLLSAKRSGTILNNIPRE